MAINNEEYINKMYDASLSGQKSQLEQNYQQNQSAIEQQQQAAQKQTDQNLTRTYVEAARDAKNYAEVQNAYGLSSGAMAQARLAQDNQLQGDLTAIRTAQQSVDADIERQRTLLGQQYSAAIAQAQAENDLQRAQALYQAAKDDEAQLLQTQREAGNLMASVGDYSILANLYGLTPEQIILLQGGGNGGGGYGGTLPAGQKPLLENLFGIEGTSGVTEQQAQPQQTEPEAETTTPQNRIWFGTLPGDNSPLRPVKQGDFRWD